MELDDLPRFQQLDPHNMLSHIDDLPDQIMRAWQHGASLPMPDWTGIDRVLIAGMGGSAIGADLLATYLSPTSPVPITVLRDYTLPAWVKGPTTLVIASSHSGNTEETLSAFEQAARQDCRCVALTTGGQLAEKAVEQGAALWRFEHAGQPRTAVGFSFSLLLAIFSRLG